MCANPFCYPPLVISEEQTLFDSNSCLTCKLKLHSADFVYYYFCSRESVKSPTISKWILFASIRLKNILMNYLSYVVNNSVTPKAHWTCALFSHLLDALFGFSADIFSVPVRFTVAFFPFHAVFFLFDPLGFCETWKSMCLALQSVFMSPCARHSSIKCLNKDHFWHLNSSTLCYLPPSFVVITQYPLSSYK